MMSMLVAAIRGKSRPAKNDNGYVLRSQYPPYVLYDSDGDEVEWNLSAMKMSYGSNSKTLLTDMVHNRGQCFWSNRTALEKNLILLICTLSAIIVGMGFVVAFLSYNRQITFVFVSQNLKTGPKSITTLLSEIPEL